VSQFIDVLLESAGGEIMYVFVSDQVDMKVDVQVDMKVDV